MSTQFLGEAGLHGRHVGEGGAGAALALALDWGDQAQGPRVIRVRHGLATEPVAGEELL